MTGAQTTQEPHQLDVALGGAIRLRRKGLGLSQTALAEAIGLTFQQIQKYERGTNRVSFSRLVAIAHALRCRVVDLIGDLDGEAPPAAGPIDDAQLTAAYALATPAVRRAVVGLLSATARLRVKRG